MVKYNEYEALRLKNETRARALAATLGHPPFDLASMISVRMEMLIDNLLGEDIPTNQKRTKFEMAYQLKYEEAVDAMEGEIRKQRLVNGQQTSRLIVPPKRG